MKLRDFKYLFAFLGPVMAFVGLHLLGVWTWGVVLLEFLMIPVLEAILKGNDQNHGPEELNRLESMRWFDFLLYINLPILWVLMGMYFSTIGDPNLSSMEWWGLTVSQGLIIGSIGINIAHEVGHRDDAFHQWVARGLLLPGLYMHFTIEHNIGHHQWVATPEDPSTSKRNEPIYFFWLRSVAGVYLKAWEIENRRLDQVSQGISRWLQHRMVLFLVIQLLYLSVVYFLFGWAVLAAAVVAGCIGFLLLESVNYIEHYGLQRSQYANGRYERVDSRHSWNSNHDLGRVFLFELTRHSDHHFKANRKYQVLRHHEDSPQLPMGYPSSILLALVPPLWFYVMNPKVDYFNQHQVELG